MRAHIGLEKDRNEDGHLVVIQRDTRTGQDVGSPAEIGEDGHFTFEPNAHIELRLSFVGVDTADVTTLDPVDEVAAHEERREAQRRADLSHDELVAENESLDRQTAGNNAQPRPQPDDDPDRQTGEGQPSTAPVDPTDDDIRTAIASLDGSGAEMMADGKRYEVAVINNALVGAGFNPITAAKRDEIAAAT